MFWIEISADEPSSRKSSASGEFKLSRKESYGMRKEDGGDPVDCQEKIFQSKMNNAYNPG